MNKAQAQAAITEAILGHVQGATGRLVEASLAATEVSGAEAVFDRFLGDLTVIHAASVAASKALDVVFDESMPSGGTESDESYRKRLEKTVDSASIHFSRIAVLKGVGLDKLGEIYDVKRR